MGFLSNLFIFNIFLFVLCFASGTIADHWSNFTCDCPALKFNRTALGPGFIFGAATASYQTEGAWNVSGKGPSIWDNYTHTHPGRIMDGSNGDIGTNSYYQFREDVRAARLMNVNSYRISISWPRLLPKGKVSLGVNPDGVRFYSELIQEIISQGLHPTVTIFHWDVPQYLEDLYGGFRSREIVEDFVNYADLLFKLFGDHVKTWITLNEPLSFSESGNALGFLAPGRCTSTKTRNCTGGNSGTEPYNVTHHQLLAHAATYRLYDTTYRKKQNGTIGITLVTHWFLPYNGDEKSEDGLAAKRALEFEFGWFMKPITFGDYPDIMKEYVGNRLPEFTIQEKGLLNGSFDFLGLNYYTGQFVHNFPKNYEPPFPSYETDARVNRTSTDINVRNLGGGPEFHNSWVHLYPLGLLFVLDHLKIEYRNPRVIITENGMCTDSSIPTYKTIYDTGRVHYLEEHVCCIQAARNFGSNVYGVIFWSLVDNFEWYFGYTNRFGLFYVDYENGYQRVPKYSALWLAGHLAIDNDTLAPGPALPPAPGPALPPAPAPTPEPQQKLRENPITFSIKGFPSILGEWMFADDI